MLGFVQKGVLFLPEIFPRIQMIHLKIANSINDLNVFLIQKAKQL